MCCAEERQAAGPPSPSPSCEQQPAWLAEAGSAQEPILLKVGQLGASYRNWVHRPVPGRPRFFASDLLENITKTPWWVVPLLWGPAIALCLARCLLTSGSRPAHSLALVAAGALAWQLLEYGIHRCLFHVIPAGRWGITAHFLFHGCHHKFPQDASRLVFPPLPAAAVAAGVWAALRALVPPAAVLPLFTGMAAGYLAYDCLHYCMHHRRGGSACLARLRAAHLHHHFRCPEAGFGISSPLFDVLLATLPAQ